MPCIRTVYTDFFCNAVMPKKDLYADGRDDANPFLSRAVSPIGHHHRDCLISSRRVIEAIWHFLGQDRERVRDLLHAN